MKKHKVIQQHDIRDCGAASLSMIGYYFGIKLPISKYRELLHIDSMGANIYAVIEASKMIGLTASAMEGTDNELIDSYSKKEINCPFMARVIINNAVEHFVVVFEIRENSFVIGDPMLGKKIIYSYKDFFEIWSGHIIIFKKANNFKKVNEIQGNFKKFYALIFKQKALLISAIIASAFISIIGLAGSWVFQYIIDDFSKSKIVDRKFYGIGAAIIGLYIIRAIIQVLRGAALATICKKIDVSLTVESYNHTVELPMNFFATRKTGEIISRFSDAAKIREAISNATLTIFLDTFMLIICSCIMWNLDYRLFTISTILVLLYAGIVYFFIKPIKSINQNVMESEAQAVSYLKESVDGIETIKAYGYEDESKNSIGLKFNKMINENVRGTIFYTLQDTLTGSVASIGIILILWMGCWFYSKNEISMGNLITFYSLLAYFLNPIKNIVNLQSTIQTANVASDRLNDILELEIEKSVIPHMQLRIIANETKRASYISFNNVFFRYGYRELILEDINIDIEKGQTIGIVGESGSGKTTLAKVLMRFYLVESGSIIINNRNINEIPLSELRGMIAYVSQDVFLFSDTIYNNLVIGNKYASFDEVKNVCEICSINSYIEQLPLGYNTLLEEGGSNLSGGQKQRISIARALLKNPSILVLDEATSNLDTITESEIKKAIVEYSDKMTCIIIAHRLSTIKECDNILVFKDGKIVENGSHNELIEKSNFYNCLWEKAL